MTLLTSSVTDEKVEGFTVVNHFEFEMTFNILEGYYVEWQCALS